MKTLSRILIVGVLLAATLATARAAESVTIAYQTGVDPAKVAQAHGQFESATGTAIRWRKFESGSEVIAAVASGDVPIGNIGSSPLAAACSRGLPVAAFLIAAELGSSEALVVRRASGITRPDQLAGRKVAVPYVSTSHYSLLNALAHWNVSPSSVHIVNLRPSEIVAAWRRGDIDGAYVWEPALGRVEEDGNVLVTSTQLAQWGAPTYDIWIVRRDFASTHAAFLTAFARTAGLSIEQFNADPKGYAASQDHLASIASVTGSSQDVARAMLLGNRYLNLAEQGQVLRQTLPKVLGDTARFLKAQGKLDAVLGDYGSCVTDAFVQSAAAKVHP